MNDWISVDKSMPDVDKLTKFLVVAEVGSMSVKTGITIMLFKPHPNGGRFLAGDWQKVTHWTPLPALPEAS